LPPAKAAFRLVAGTGAVRAEAGTPLGPRVVDLAQARRRRRRDPEAYGDEGAWGATYAVDDEEESFWDEVFNDAPMSREAWAYAEAHPQVRFPLLAIPWDEGLREAAEEGDLAIAHALELLTHVSPDDAVDALADLVGDLDPDSGLFGWAVERLMELEPRGSEEIAGLIARADMRTATRLAPVLVSSRRARRDLRVFELLADLLRRAPWADGKERVAAALEEYGDARAVPLLESALRSLEPRTLYQEAVVRRALDRLTRARRRGGRPGTDG
jgi:hypothetical protein